MTDAAPAPQPVLVRSLDEAQVHIAALSSRCAELERQVRAHEDWIDTYLATPLWKRLLFTLDGWPRHRIVDRPAWRPWRRWWVS